MSGLSKKSKRILAFLVVFAMFALSACSNSTPSDSGTGGGAQAPAAGNPDTPEPEEAVVPGETEPTGEDEADEDDAELSRYDKIPERDLGGKEILLSNWWGEWDAYTYEAKGASDEAGAEWRRHIQEKYNFKMKEVQVGNWGEMQELISTSIMAGTPIADSIVVDQRWFIALYNQGMFAPVSDGTVDFHSWEFARWNQGTVEATTFGGKVYGFSGERSISTAGGVYFNKRLFEEAGVDPELPYDLQKAGTWTWDKFEEICRSLTRDVTNDGIIDTYAIASFHGDTFRAMLTSNNAKYADKDASGKYFNATKTPEFLETLQWSVKLFNEGYIMPQPEGTAWNWFEQAFLQGQAAMRIAGSSIAGNLVNDMADDYGFVAFPKGPNADNYIGLQGSTIYTVPSTFTPEEVDDITWAIMLWFMPAPGYEADDSWKSESYNRFRDARAVDETMDLLRNTPEVFPDYTSFIPGLDPGDIVYNMWFDDADPASLIESVELSWNSIIEEANKVQ